MASVGIKLNPTIFEQKFGNLTVIKPSPYRDRWEAILWQCQCDCGKIVYLRRTQFLSGNTSSCGCKKRTIKRRNKRDYFDIPRSIKSFRSSQFHKYLSFEEKSYFWRMFTVKEAIPKARSLYPNFAWEIYELDYGNHPIKEITNSKIEGRNAVQRLFQIKEVKTKGALVFPCFREEIEEGVNISYLILLCAGTGFTSGRDYLRKDRLNSLWNNSARTNNLTSNKTRFHGKDWLKKIETKLLEKDSLILSKALTERLKNSRSFYSKGCLRNILLD